MIKNPAGKQENDRIMLHQNVLKRRKLLIGAGTLAPALFMMPSLIIAQTQFSDGARKINFSGRQRMLIQRTGKFVCLAYQNPNPGPFLAAAAQTLALHQKTEAGLTNGDHELGLEPETNTSVLNALTRANRVFEPYGQTIREAIERRGVELDHLQKIAELNGNALGEMDAAVNIIERVYKSAELSEKMAMLINISGRQRMFTQRLILLLCLSRGGVIANDIRQDLFRTMNRFSLSLNILIRVTPGALQDEKSAPIIQRLNSAQNAWATLKELISTTTWSAGDQYIADIQNADKQSEDLLKRMNEIVLLYEEAAS